MCQNIVQKKFKWSEQARFSVNVEGDMGALRKLTTLHGQGTFRNRISCICLSCRVRQAAVSPLRFLMFQEEFCSPSVILFVLLTKQPHFFLLRRHSPRIPGPVNG